MKYDLLSPIPPRLPEKLPGFVRDAISQVPDYMKPAAANAIFPAAAAQTHDVKFRYIDNKVQEFAFMECCVAQSGVGKGFLDSMIEVLTSYLKKHDTESRRKLAEYNRICNTRGDNKDKPDRPLDSAILLPEPDMTNAALVQLLQDAEREGNRSIFTNLSEIDLLDKCCGSHKQITRVIRLNFDTKDYGAERATSKGVSGKAKLRWKFIASCVPEKAVSFFKDSILDGTFGRISFSYIPKPAKQKKKGRKVIPRQGDYDKAYYDTVEEYLVRLRAATGEIKVPKIDNLITRICDELDDIAVLSDNDTFESISYRSINIGWQRGCLLYIANKYKWSKEIADFVEWSIYYDLWSKIAVFAIHLKNTEELTIEEIRKYGPSNMLDELSTSFSKIQLEELRKMHNMSSNTAKQLENWRLRGYITFDATTELYTKTEEYLAKHPERS